MKPQILRDLRFLFSLVVACGPAGVPGAGGPGRCVCRWAAARPRDRHTRACGSEWSISRPALALPPPTGTAARPRHRPSISHVIPLRLVQTLNLRRWNCNVFGVSRKMTAINYVRNMGGGDVLAARGHRSQAPCLEAFPVLSFACNSRAPAVRHLVKSPEFQRLYFKA